MSDQAENLDVKQRLDLRVSKNLSRRRAAEARFTWIGRGAVSLAMIFLAVLFISIFKSGIPGFFQYYVTLELNLDTTRMDPEGDGSMTSLYSGDARGIINDAIFKILEPQGRSAKRDARKIVSAGGEKRLRHMAFKNPKILGQTVKVAFAVDDDIDSFLRGYIRRDTPESDRRISDSMIGFIDTLKKEKLISYQISDYLFFGSASRNAEMAGIKGAFIGSIITLSICLTLAFPLGVATAIYLEEFAPKNRLIEFIEININNLAAVPSVVFGILGLAIFINLFGIPRSIPLVGGIVLALMTLPTIIISSRAAISAVPPSIKNAALSLGASKHQAIFHHVLPLAMPGILTGTIIGMAQALGETAPLLMIGMVAFIVDLPNSVTDPATVLPVQIFMWADFSERMFIHKTSAAIMVLLAFLISMNIGAIWLRKKLERRW